MDKPASFISFSDGRCRRLRRNDIQGQIEETIMACDATQCGANLLDASLRVVAKCVRDVAAQNGFVVVDAG